MAKKANEVLPAASPEAAMAGDLVVALNADSAALKELMLPGETYDLDLYANRLHAAENQAQFALLEIGRIFRVMQIQEGPNFAVACERVGRTVSYGYRMSALHEKLGTGERAKLLSLGTSKAMEFLVFEGDELDRIAANTMPDMTLDDVDRMPVKKLREAIRKMRTAAQENQQATDQIVEARDKRIKELQKAVRLGNNYDLLAPELVADVAREGATISASIRTLIERVTQFGQLEDYTEDQMSTLRSVVQNVRAVASELEGLVS